MNLKIKNKLNIKSEYVDKLLFYALIAFSPIFFLPASFLPVALGKQLFVGSMVLTLFIYILVKFLSSGKLAFPQKSISIPAFAVFLMVLISTLFSQARGVSFLSSEPDSLFWISMYILAFFIPIAILKRKKYFKETFMAFLFGVVVLAIFSLLQLLEVFILPWSITKNVGFSPVGGVFAATFLIVSAFSATVTYLLMAETSKKSRILLWSLVGFFSLFILQINLWTIWISIAFAFSIISVVIGAKMVRNKSTNLQPILLPFLVVMISLFFVMINPTIPTFIANTAEIGLPVETTLNIAEEGLSGLRWIWGTGPGTFSYNYSLYKPIEMNQTAFWSVQFSQGYSAVSTSILTWGIFGTLSLVIFLGIILFKILKGLLIYKQNEKEEKLYVFATIFLVSAMSLVPALFIYRGNATMHLFLFLSLGVSVAALARMGIIKAKNINVTENPQLMIASSLVALLIISGAFGSLYLLGQKYLGQVYLSQAIRNYEETQDITKTIEKLQSALEINSKDDSILRASAQILVLHLGQMVENKDLASEDTSNQFGTSLNKAIVFAREATDVNPKDTRNWIQLGQTWESVIGFVGGAEEQAVAAYEEARLLDPNNPSILLGQARAYMTAAEIIQTQLATLTQSGKSTAQEEKQLADQRITFYNDVIEKLNEAIELKSDYSSARLLLVSAYQRLGEIDKAIKETKTLSAITPTDPNLAFQLGLLYYQNENYDLAKNEFKRAIVLADNQFGNARYYLGLSQYNLGNKKEALAQFNTLKEDNLENELVGTIISNINAGRGPFENLEAQEDQLLIEEE